MIEQSWNESVCRTSAPTVTTFVVGCDPGKMHRVQNGQPRPSQIKALG